MVHECWELYSLEQHINGEIVNESVLLLLADLLHSTRSYDLKVALAGCLWQVSSINVVVHIFQVDQDFHGHATLKRNELNGKN